MIGKLFDNNNAIDHIGNIYIESAEYCKMEIMAEHEFILLDVKDKSDESKSTVLMLHRIPRHERTTRPTDDDIVQEGLSKDGVQEVGETGTRFVRP